MYSTLCKEYYKIYDVSVDEFTDYFYSEEELIKFIARWYHYTYEWVGDTSRISALCNDFINLFTCDEKELYQNNKRYILYDNYDRIININDFVSKAFNFYLMLEKNGKASSYCFDFWWRWKRVHQKTHYASSKYLQKANNYRFRKDPVPYTRKMRGGPRQSPPHTAKIMRMYANPEYKDFNRGSPHGIPSWWDDRYREVQKSWKEQTKAKRQWAKKFY